MSAVKHIAPSRGYKALPDPDLLTKAIAVQTGLYGNPAFANPPIDAAALKSAIESYAVAIGGALDGSKTAMADRDKQRTEILDIMRQLGHYVETACKGELSTFLSSGFEPLNPTRAAPQPLAQPAIVRIDQGTSGQLLVNIKPVPSARSYELRYTAVEAGGGIPGPWTTTVVPSGRGAVAFDNLTPGTTYTFQVRAFGKLGFTDWSHVARRMCI